MRSMVVLITLIIISNYSIAQEDKEIIRKIYDEQLTNSQVYENLRHLSKKIGSRLEGSSNLDSALQFTSKLMLQYKFDSVYLQPIMITNWKRGDLEKVKIVSATGLDKELNCLALGNSVGTSEKGVTGNVIEINGMDELGKTNNNQIKGKIVFLNEPLDQRIINSEDAYNNVSDQRNFGTSLASKKGAIGVIIRSLSIGVDTIPHTGYTEYEKGVNKIPAVAISTKDANFLSDLLKQYSDLKVNITLNCKTLDSVRSYNVIGEIKGSRAPDSLVVVGGHIDSWDVGESAQDDGGGCMQSIEVLRMFKVLKIKPIHTIRVVMWTGEENSWSGKIEYANQAGNKGEKHFAAIESDKGSYTPMGFKIDTENHNAYEKVLSWKPLFEPYWVTIFERGHAGVDIDPLKNDSNLLLGLLVDNHKMFTVHHSEKDTFETVDKRELELGAAALTAIVYLLDKYGIK